MKLSSLNCLDERSQKHIFGLAQKKLAMNDYATQKLDSLRDTVHKSGIPVKHGVINHRLKILNTYVFLVLWLIILQAHQTGNRGEAGEIRKVLRKTEHQI